MGWGVRMKRENHSCIKLCSHTNSSLSFSRSFTNSSCIQAWNQAFRQQNNSNFQSGECPIKCPSEVWLTVTWTQNTSEFRAAWTEIIPYNVPIIDEFQGRTFTMSPKIFPAASGRGWASPTLNPWCDFIGRSLRITEGKLSRTYWTPPAPVPYDHYCPDKPQHQTG